MDNGALLHICYCIWVSYYNYRKLTYCLGIGNGVEPVPTSWGCVMAGHSPDVGSGTSPGQKVKRIKTYWPVDDAIPSPLAPFMSSIHTGWGVTFRTEFGRWLWMYGLTNFALIKLKRWAISSILKNIIEIFQKLGHSGSFSSIGRSLQYPGPLHENWKIPKVQHD